MFKLSSKNDVFIFSCVKRMRFFKVIFSEMNGICRKDIVSKTTRRHWPDSRTFFDIGLYMFVCSAFSCKPIQISVYDPCAQQKISSPNRSHNNLCKLYTDNPITPKKSPSMRSTNMAPCPCIPYAPALSMGSPLAT